MKVELCCSGLVDAIKENIISYSLTLTESDEDLNRDNGEFIFYLGPPREKVRPTHFLFQGCPCCGCKPLMIARNEKDGET